jgi:hypothetical protein
MCIGILTGPVILTLTRRSTSGYIVMMAGGLISPLLSKLQSIVASSMEAEYVSAYPSVPEVTWVCAALHYLELTRDKSITLLIDNQCVIDLVYFNRQVNTAVISTYKYASPNVSLPRFTVSAF